MSQYNFDMSSERFFDKQVVVYHELAALIESAATPLSMTILPIVLSKPWLRYSGSNPNDLKNNVKNTALTPFLHRKKIRSIITIKVFGGERSLVALVTSFY